MMQFLDTQIELNEDFLPNSNFTYDIYFDGDLTFEARLSEINFTRRVVSVEDAPTLLRYKMDKPLDNFTQEEKAEILAYRGLTLNDGFCEMDVFMEKSYISLKPMFFQIEGYWKDNNSEMIGIVSEYDSIDEENENDIFYYGLSESNIKQAILDKGNDNLDFVITSYQII